MVKFVYEPEMMETTRKCSQMIYIFVYRLDGNNYWLFTIFSNVYVYCRNDCVSSIHSIKYEECFYFLSFDWLTKMSRHGFRISQKNTPPQPW